MASNEAQPGGDQRGRLQIGRLLALVVLAVWAAHFLMIFLLLLARDWDTEMEHVPLRAVAHVVGALISMLIVAVHVATGSRPLWQRVCITFGAAFAGAATDAAVTPTMIGIVCGPEFMGQSDPVILGALQRLWFYAFLSSVILAFTYNASLRERDQRLAFLSGRVHAAQMKVLRYQLNPHFLFNTLNAISALVRRKQHGAAEVMIENLSDFLRAGLALDPQEDIALERELQLQSLYLAIERLRFPGRLTVVDGVPDGLRSALVPSLSTLPLMEQAVRSALSRTGDSVILVVSAHRRRGNLHVSVATRGAADAGGARGDVDLLSGLSDRLRVRFGSNYDILRRRDAAGESEVELIIPYQAATAVERAVAERLA